LASLASGAQNQQLHREFLPMNEFKHKLRMTRTQSK